MISSMKTASLPLQVSTAQAGKAANNQSGFSERTAFSTLFGSLVTEAGLAGGEETGEQLTESAEALAALEGMPAEELEAIEELAMALLQNLSVLTKELEDKMATKELPQALLRQVIEQLQTLSAMAANAETGEKILLSGSKEFEQVLKQLTAIMQQEGLDTQTAGQQLVKKLEELELLLKQWMNPEAKTELQKQASPSESQASDAFRQLPGNPLEGNSLALPGASLESAKAGRSEPALPTPTVRMMNLTEELGEVLKGSFRLNGTAESTQQIRVNIAPENLGQLDIRLSIANGKMAAQIFTSTFAAKEMIELQINQLRTSLLQQGVTIDKIEITQHNPQQSFGQQHTPPEQRFGQQQKPGNGSHKNGYQRLEEEAASAAPQNLPVSGNLKVDYTI